MIFAPYISLWTYKSPSPCFFSEIRERRWAAVTRAQYVTLQGFQLIQLTYVLWSMAFYNDIFLLWSILQIYFSGVGIVFVKEATTKELTLNSKARFNSYSNHPLWITPPGICNLFFPWLPIPHSRAQIRKGQFLTHVSYFLASREARK